MNTVENYLIASPRCAPAVNHGSVTLIDGGKLTLNFIQKCL